MHRDLEIALSELEADVFVLDDIFTNLERVEGIQLQSKKELFDEWSDKIYEPIASQIKAHVYGALTQCAGVGKSSFKARVDSKEDPLKRVLFEPTAEKSIKQRIDAAAGFNIQTPATVTRKSPIRLAPQSWARTQFYSTPEGNAARALESGEMYRPAHRVKIRVESDPAGVRRNGSRGILDAQSLTRKGATGALCQDHYNFSRKNSACDAEFSKGKRYIPLHPIFRRNPLCL